jgi:hypothetical protein
MAIAVVGVALLAAFPVSGEPLDVLDAGPRVILLEIEVSPSPGSVGQQYSAPYPATYSVSGGTGTVTLAGALYESHLDSHGGPGGAIPSPGTFSDYTLEIDLSTLDVTGQVWGLLIYPAGSLSTNVSTTTAGGFIIHPDVDGPLFCDPQTLPGCTLIPAAAYDPQTGKLNALGPDRVSSHFTIDLFSFVGDVRLREVPPPQSVPSVPRAGLLVMGALLLFGGAIRALSCSPRC